jgi:hypothetical protein
MKKQLQDIFIGNSKASLDRAHNNNLDGARDRLMRGNSYKDLSTVCVIATRGVVPWRVVSSWWSLITPMNQKFLRIGVENMEVGEAYNQAVETILNNPELSKWKYMLTIEEDNCPPPDGLLKLYESMDKFDVVGGLYWTKGECGQPMIYGDPNVMPQNYIPQLPRPETVQRANGLGMGFNLFKIDIFRKVPKPWFKTLQEYKPGIGTEMATQDLYFYKKAALDGFKFACDTRVKVGHWDQNTQTMW